MTYKLGSLFDGSGGFPLAGSLSGIEPVWASEVEPYPIAVTRSRFPNMKHLGDISKINGAEVEPVDIITFGSPCQDLSVAGKRAGLKHEANGDEETTRSGLFMEAVRIIKEMREATNGTYPRFALWENVPGAFSSNKGEDFRIVLEELIKVVEPTAVMPAVPKNGWPYADSYCGDGWSLAYRVFDAQFWGVPQRRRRIYLVADFRGQCAGEVSFKREGVRGYFETGRTPWKETAGYAESGIGAADCGVTPYTLKIRSGCEGGGKGALVQTNMSATLATNNDQYLFQPMSLREENWTENTVKNAIRAGESKSSHVVVQPVVDQHILDDQGGSQISVRTDGKSPALRAETHGNLPCVVEQHLFENHSQDSRYRGPLEVCPMLPAQLGTGGNNQPFVVSEEVIPINDKATRWKGGGSTRNHDGSGNGLGVGQPGDPFPTLTAGDRHAVAYAMQGFGDYKESDVASGLKARDYKDATDLAVYVDTTHADDVVRIDDKVAPLQARDYKGGKLICEKPIAIDRAFFNQGQNALYDPQLYEDGTNPTLVARDPNAVAVRYIVRRLTPTECARLQGFPDKWGHPDQKEDFTDEEFRFWQDVRNTHATVIGGKEAKEYMKEQMLTWYNKLHTDSAEYKMWGNGISLPTALYCLQGVADVLNGESRMLADIFPQKKKVFVRKVLKHREKAGAE